LARVGDKYSDEWHRAHLANPRSVVPESIMPAYAFLETTDLNMKDAGAHLKANRMVGVPYTDDQIANAQADLVAQASVDGAEAMLARYPKSQARDYDGNPGRVSEMDALIAYLQMLGTLVDFNAYKAEENVR
jgi:cytochrome c oxidase cbb3-type subunit 2